MSEEFGKWLKKNKLTNMEAILISDVSTYSDSIIPVRALGKWAWKRFKEQYAFALELYENNLEQMPTYDFDCESWDCNEGEDESLFVFMEIAVSCLGRAEVERRLKNV